MATPETSGPGQFWSELKRRRVIRVVIMYAIAGWVVIEIASTVLPNLNLPDWSVTLVTVLVALGFVIAILMAWAFDINAGSIQRTPPAEAAAAKQAPASPRVASAETDERKSIAVLPFVNMSGDAENEYFSDGISEEILNLLVKLPKLRVASRTSAFAFKGKDFDIPQVAERLGVSTVLEGSVRRAGERVRITAQLIETASDSHLWSETYDRELKDVFAIQDEIAQSIVDALQVTLTPKERRALQYVATSNAEAYDYYLRGRKYFYSMSGAGFHHAVEMYQKAIKLDPNYAVAWAGMADAWSFVYRYSDASMDNATRAQEASEKAVSLDPDSAEAHVSRGLALFITERYEEAEQHFETAIRLNPNLFECWFFYGLRCYSQGDFPRAAELFTKASEINPDDYQALSFLGMSQTAQDQHDQARETTLRTIAVIERHLDMNPHDVRGLYMAAANYATLGEFDKARLWVTKAREAAPNEQMVLYNVACTLSLMGDTDEAIELLERAVELGWGDRAWLETDTDLDNIRNDPRFQAMLDRIH